MKEIKKEVKASSVKALKKLGFTKFSGLTLNLTDVFLPNDWNVINEVAKHLKGAVIVPVCGCGGLDEGGCYTCGTISAYTFVNGKKEDYHYAIEL